MRAAWAILAGLAVGGGLAWWLTRGEAAPSPEARERAEKAAAEAAEDALRPLYRWRDDAGNLHITDTPPPPGRAYERLAREPEPGIRVKTGG